ncbi:hypothetical protein [Wolbachia endosymbiont of Litomosoides brasiliensis]|nr:hypothetical protein [Wolbachia endosymbiont of Litomosoides brasiliensis]
MALRWGILYPAAPGTDPAIILASLGLPAIATSSRLCRMSD